ncbi:MAG TPA: SusD/RagB family nutrient-binding outer membrane lipoprotein [Bacteroidales bacterium]|nr:SusD/RagB family nutrient-binding outer membrane lipoprotein [Bacteroidales bacterium]HNS45776.1 SusD/RagB family nutrient-binding outer membrane lipoprotein [Bacteroidales bacterium]
MKKIVNLNILLVLVLIFSSISCTKNFEEMNVNPNQPSDVPSTNILAFDLRYVGDNLFNAWQGMNEMCSYAGHISKIQYIDEARYEFREGVVNNAWAYYYYSMNDLKVIQDKSDAEGTPNMKAVAMTFQAMLLQMTTDQWGNVPWRSALKGTDPDDQVTLPPYDPQSQIYDDILAQLKAAADLFAEGHDDDLGDGDLLFHGDVSKWQKFCNSLRLRAAIRMSIVNPGGAKAVIEEVLGNAGKYPVMQSNDDNAFMYWPGTSPYKEPYYEDSETRDDHGVCSVLVDIQLANNDPRLPVYAHPNPDGVYKGVDPGAVDDSEIVPTTSRIGAIYRDDPAGFTPFMRYAEVAFIIAEAAKNGWGTPGWTAQSAYEAGIVASMEENGVAAGDIETYMAQPAIAWNNDMKQIYLEKWICLYKQGQEAWAENRRTDVPAIDVAPGSVYVGVHNRQPFRYPYPTTEANLNATNLEPEAAKVVDQFWGERMWWDKRTGVN